jgi:HPt (histidine-containing phosphotransfer) domain-containing protein
MIDWSRVTTLRDEVGSEDFDEVVELFLEEVDDVVARLETAPEPLTLSEDLHFLKGSAMSLGFRQFSALCQAGENAAAQGKAENVNIQEILGNYKRSRQHFLEELKNNLHD